MSDLGAPATTTAGFHGADVDALDRVAGRAGEAAGTIAAMLGRIQLLIISLRAAAWFTGGASAAYADHLETVVLPWLRQIHTALELAARTLGEQAGQQRDASADGGYLTPPLPPGDCADPAWARSAWNRRLEDAVDATGHATGATVTIVDEVGKRTVRIDGYTRADGTQVRGHARWPQGTADRMRHLGSATVWREAMEHPATRTIGRTAPWAFAGATQTIEDWEDPTLTRGDRIARTGSAVALEGGGAVVGGLAGAKAGALIGAGVGSVVPGVGTAVGGIVGGIVGALGVGYLGGQAGAYVHEHVADDLIDDLGDRVDVWLGDAPATLDPPASGPRGGGGGGGR